MFYFMIYVSKFASNNMLKSEIDILKKAKHPNLVCMHEIL